MTIYISKNISLPGVSSLTSTGISDKGYVSGWFPTSPTEGYWDLPGSRPTFYYVRQSPYRFAISASGAPFVSGTG
jgi:hypothetical protein